MSDQQIGNESTPAPGAAMSGGTSGQDDSATKVDDSGQDQAGGNADQKPNRAELRIKQLVRERDQEREARLTAEGKLDGMASRQTSADSKGDTEPNVGVPDLVKNEVERQVRAQRLTADQTEARQFILGQEGFDSEIDDGLMGQIAEENGWDELYKSQPVKAAKLTVKAWRKVRGLDSTDAGKKKSQAASIQGSASPPTGSKSVEEINAQAQPLRPDRSNVDEVRKSLDKSWDQLRNLGSR